MINRRKRALAISGGLVVLLGVGTAFAVPAIQEARYEKEQAAFAERFETAAIELQGYEAELGEIATLTDLTIQAGAGAHAEALDYADVLQSVSTTADPGLPKDLATRVGDASAVLTSALEDIEVGELPEGEDAEEFEGVIWLNTDPRDLAGETDTPELTTPPDEFTEEIVAALEAEAIEAGEAVSQAQEVLDAQAAIFDEIHTVVSDTQGPVFAAAEAAAGAGDPLGEKWDKADEAITAATKAGERAQAIALAEAFTTNDKGRVVVAKADTPEGDLTEVTDAYRLVLAADALASFKTKVADVKVEHEEVVAEEKAAAEAAAKAEADRIAAQQRQQATPQRAPQPSSGGGKAPVAPAKPAPSKPSAPSVSNPGRDGRPLPPGMSQAEYDEAMRMCPTPQSPGCS